VISNTVTADVATRSRSEMVDVTPRVADAVRRSEVKTGLAIVYVPHTTAGVAINENADPGVQRDVLAKLEELIPKRETYYRHGEGNSDSHVKTILTGNSATVLIDNGRLVLGQWQGIYLMEFDGPRTRQLVIRIVDHGRRQPN
jgi:secondary thiamine-phosphate synthase enzyme